MKLLKELCSIHAPSGEEFRLTEFLLNYIELNKNNWKTKPEIFHGEDFQDCIILVFGKPRTMIFAHLDSVGFTVRYNNQLIRIGSPDIIHGTKLVGYNGTEVIETELNYMSDGGNYCHTYPCEIARGTSLTFKPEFIDSQDFIQSPFLDNRLGVWTCLNLAENLESGIIVFSCWEEHKGGTVPYLTKFIYEKYKINQALICDITWITEGIHPGKGVVISMRDVGIPRRKYIDRIISIAEKHKIDYQLEVESSGGSDGTELQLTPYPIDWCFVGAAEDEVHSPNERVHKKDIESMLNIYRVLMNCL